MTGEWSPGVRLGQRMPRGPDAVVRCGWRVVDNAGAHAAVDQGDRAGRDPLIVKGKGKDVRRQRIVADADRVTHESLADAHEAPVLLHREGAESYPCEVFEQIGHRVGRQDDLVIAG